MSNDSSNSPLRSLWHAMLVLLGCVIVMWLIVKIIAGIWIWLVVIAGVVVVICAAVIVVRFWLSRSYWRR